MLDFYFESERRRRQLRRGPLSGQLEGVAAECQRHAYSRNTARRLLSVIGQFSHWAGIAGVAVGQIDQDTVDRFLAQELVSDGLLQDGRRAMGHLLRYVQTSSLSPRSMGPRPPHRCASTLDGFDRYLRDVRGFAPTTRTRQLVQARALLDWLGVRHGGATPALGQLAGTDVLEFITAQLARGGSRSWRGHLCSHVRGFLRYLHASGAVAEDLSRVVPRVRTARLAQVPRGLPWEQVRSLIDTVDVSHPDGIRDKAILLLLATLGLRSGEVRGLELGEISWRAGEIRIARTKTRRERVLPLLAEVGAALADYVLHGRPALAVPQVFLRHAPWSGPFTTPNTVIHIVRRHLQRAGIRGGRGGAHMLRHSLATRMVNAGVPIKSVADVLGHASINTTAIYTKVDTTTLATVALPFPGGTR
jgi:integrase/recombinase XerD